MKKTYIIPETIVVRLMPVTIIAGSDPQTNDDTPIDEGQIGFVKESGNNTNVWDEEW